MSIQLVTYANQTVTPTNDAIIYERAIDQNGIFYGCNVTVSSNNVNITGGYGIICGREFTIQSESIAVTLAPSGTLDGRLYVRLDLADADAPIQLLTATGNTLPPLEQDSDVNYINGVWEMELATFDVGVSSLSNVVMTYETIVGAKAGLPTIENATPGSVADFITTNTGFTVSDVRVVRYGKVMMGNFLVQRNASWNAGSTGNIGNLTLAYRPNTTAYIGGASFTGLVDSGDVYLRPTSTIAANSQERVAFTIITH